MPNKKEIIAGIIIIGNEVLSGRTKDIKHIMYGTEFSLKGRVYRTILEPICYIVGLFIRG